MFIIKTPCSKMAACIDIFMTALAWAGLLYLSARGIAPFLESAYAASALERANGPLPLLYTFLAYLAVALLNAALLIVARRYHRTFFADATRRDGARQLEDATVASHFEMSSSQLHALRQSRIALIYHDTTGGIFRIEPHQRRLAAVKEEAREPIAELA